MVGLLAEAASPRVANARCHASCERLMESRLKATVCGACLVSDGPAAWLFKTASQPEGALTDLDWAVRWEAWQRKAGGPEAARRALVERGAKAPHERTLHCTTLAHVSAAAPGTDGGLGATCLEAARRGLEAELLSTEAWQRNDALAHAPRALGVPVGRFVLDALEGKHPAAAFIAWQALVAAEDHAGPTAAALLTAQATGRDAAAMNQLLQRAAQEVDLQRSALDGSDDTRRREAIRALTPYSPWTRAALEPLVLGPRAADAQLAARALARGAGQPLGDFAQAVVSDPATSPALRSAWLTVLSHSGPSACEGVLRGLATDRTRPDELRRQALGALAACARGAAVPLIEQVAAEPALALRAAAIAAAGNVPRNARATALVDRALEDPEPLVLRAALQAANAAGLAPTRYAAFSQHADDGVRADALGALLRARPLEAAAAVCGCVEKDLSALVRAACAEHLGAAGTPGLQARATLARAAEHDPDPRVKMAAAAALRRLPGAVPLPSEPRPP